ncbi:hypothetical protein ACHHYP_01321 [Achlya hypogyna]|uniref:TFIIS N-terminal domain-containing protein n=1 Tax=Achlya hypogyna TaxID=1202772 RepID=A0A1V9Z8T4_ACHHY|nr:hypothetical protein ACHHYP_01321 [Achlya hypogyna]
MEENLDVVAWGLLEGYPWWPVYVCDPNKLRNKLFHLGSQHMSILRQARNFPKDFRIVYFFGSAEFGKMRKASVRQWDGPDKEAYIKGRPIALTNKKGIADLLKAAIEEAEEFLATDESTRLLPHMVPSDMDPTLEPPPTPEHVPEDDDDEVEEVFPDEDDDISEDDKMLKPKKTKKKAEPKAKKEKVKKEKVKKEKVKKEKVKKEKSMPASTKAEPTAKPAADAPPRKSVEVPGDADSASPLKRKASDSSAANIAKKPKSDSLEDKIEFEIRHILETMSLDELTTRKVRAMLETKLAINLKEHKNLIRDVINRIIAQVDAEAPEDPPIEAPATPTFESIVAALEAKSALMPIITSVLQLKDKFNPAQRSVLVPHVLEWRSHSDATIVAAATVLYNDWKIEAPAPTNEAPATINDETTVSKNEPPATKDETTALTTDNVKQFKALLTDTASSDEVLVATLEKLSKALRCSELRSANMRTQGHIEVKTMRSSGILSVVTSLRNNSNTAVAGLAKSLRLRWKEECADDMKKQLVAMSSVLNKEGDDEAHSATLTKLLGMSLTTDDIINSHIGHAVTRVRKNTSSEAVKTLASDLRAKWKKLAQHQ